MSAEIFRSLEAARRRFGPCALAIGNFDGVHIGHQSLLRETVRCGAASNVVPAVLTFDPHPTAVVAPDRMPQAISSLEQRLEWLEAAGVKRILVLPFTPELARLLPEEFVSEILINALETRAVFVGENFRFGNRQSGTPEVFQDLAARYGFALRFMKPVTFRGRVVSSSAIRQYLEAGRVAQAGRLLGRCFSLRGTVVSGHGIGSKQTVPTLNLRPAADQVVPRGVYVTETRDRLTGRRWHSITNAGVRPTFGGNELTVETFLLDALEGETPREIGVDFRHFVRAERQFPNPEMLKAQILRDVGRAKAYWRRTAKLVQPASSIY
ncbi:MAG: bifunctional riboflavin kinase/FAD synthetase [Acidobacteriaceae bacterium]|nr:bifunctional riboflavin kinase/FAD synthetase [Acidobacteriaceae bacterium]